MVLHKGVRHTIPDMDILEGLDISDKDWYFLNASDVNLYEEGPPLEACDKAAPTGNTCPDSVYYKALHHGR